jgi:small-conductance mechanosensitive channel
VAPLHRHSILALKRSPMLTAFIQRLWASHFPTQLVYAICTAAVGELLLLLAKWQIRRALHPILARAAGEDAAGRVRRRRIVLGLPITLARTLIYAVALLMIARYFGFRPNFELYPVAAVVAVLAAIAFRSVLRDAVRGYYLMYDHLYSVGDEVRVGDATGVVQELSLRSTTLLTRDGKEVVVPNGDIRTVVNFSRGLKAD